MTDISKIENFINNIPPLPENLKRCKKALESGDLVMAADFAKDDRALMVYLREIVNKPYFGFKNEVKDARQIFGILGIISARQIISSYFLRLAEPKSWVVFDINRVKFADMQAIFIKSWEKILDFLDCKDKDIAESIVLIPAALLVCEDIFKENLEDLNILKNSNDISYEKILVKFTGYNFFEIVGFIAQKWEFSDKVIEIINNLSQKEEDLFAKYIHLLIFYIFSKPEFVESGLSGFLELDIDYITDIYPPFLEIMEVK